MTPPTVLPAGVESRAPKMKSTPSDRKEGYSVAKSSPTVYPAPTVGQVVNGVVSIVGALLCLPLAALVAFGFETWLTRMDCSQEILGSGCYESEFGLSLILFALIFVPFLILSLALSLPQRHQGWRNWWPLTMLVIVPVLTAVVLSALMAMGSA